MSYPIQARYDFFNRQFFEGKLPAIPLDMRPLKGMGGMVQFQVRKPVGSSINYSLVEGSLKLTLSNLFQKTEAETDAILLHEMIHVYFAANGDYKEQHGAKFMAMRRALSQKSGILIPVTERVNDLTLTSSKTKPVAVMVLKKEDGAMQFGVMAVQGALKNAQVMKDQWAGRTKFSRLESVGMYIIDSLLWTSQAAKMSVSRNDIKGLANMRDPQLIEDIRRNARLVWAVDKTTT